MKKLIAVLLLLFVLVASTSCYFSVTSNGFQAGTQPPDQTQTPSQTQTVPVNITPPDASWTAPIASENSPVLPDIATVVQQAYPSVVTITTEQVVNDMFSRQVTQSGAGSGWILDKSGIIVTNNHVVEGASKVAVQFSDGRTFEGNAANVFRDPLTDLAIVKIDMQNLPAAAIGDSSTLRVGDWLVALGNPLGQGIRASEGIVSGLKITLSMNDQESLYDLIGTSAAINPGNSGGPLLNMRGQVIGITSAKIAEVGVEGLGYAISMNSAMPVLQELINKGYVTRPFLGLELYTVNDYVAYYNGLGVNQGAVITFVQPGSPAAKAGLKKLDVITKYQGQDIPDAPTLLNDLRNSKIGDVVSITYMRGKATLNTTATLITSPPPSQ
ncbi:MAG: trypsin-like peptidase domain-containing protein [Dehalococcoidia bacterium]